MSYNEVPNRIAEKYSKMTKSEKRIADYFLEQKRDLQLTSITELAEQCSVADSTIFRFCKMQGRVQGTSDAEGKEFDIYSSITTEDDIPTTGQKLAAMYSAALEQTQELLRPTSVEMAAHILLQSERVYCFGQGGSLITAMEAWVRFSAVARHFETIQDTYLQVISATLLTEKDTIWFFSYSGSTKDMADILGQARQRGAKVIVVTRYAKSPATKYADVVLICGSNESPLQSGSIVAKVSQLFVIDMVYQEYIRMAPEECENNRNLTSQAVANRLL